MSQDQLSPLSSYTKNRFTIIGILNHLCMAVLGFSVFIVSKRFDANELQIILLTNGPQLLFLSAYFFSVLMAGRNKSPFLYTAGIVSRLSLLACVFVTSSEWFTALVFLTFLGEPIFIPAMNAIGQRNLRPQHRGRITGSVTMWSVLSFILCTLIVGNLLDQNDDHMHWLFPLAGISGLLAYMYAAKMRVRVAKRIDNTKRFKQSLHALMDILRSNRAFLHFELAFFLYGVGFMVCMPINMIVLTQELSISYQEFAVGITVLSALCLALCSPFGGKLFDLLGPTTSCGICFLLLTVHPFLMMQALHIGNELWAYAAYIVFGVALSGINASWSNGPMYYAGKDDSALYMGVHMSNVGIRAVIGSTLVIMLTKSASVDTYAALYVFTILMFFAAAIYMFVLQSRPVRVLS